ncbi:nascent polypeptide-associated complex subunit alpha, muscle-specific form-like isoform X2 [Numida meleagris]|uniref:nascent polypeptide-associated complex subunit alpha, muscle-specific form-like isoform X2 n=1 Tax=Numida meleagris TaxID=8996 RepID=UPI000B3E24B6|nr:nascent polypeptide-associated complex subunit alpha, muscle-specific form-like isoform X2 [Numida meleagris]
MDSGDSYFSKGPITPSPNRRPTRTWRSSSPKKMGRRPQQAVLPGSQSRDSSIRDTRLPPLPHLESARASGSRRAQADRLELRQALHRSSVSAEGRRPLPPLPPLPRQATPPAAAPQNAAAAHGQVPTLPTLPATASRSSPRGGARAVGATASRLAVLVPRLQGNPERQDMAMRAEGWEAVLRVPAPPLKPANETPKSLRLAYRRRPAATGAGPCQKPAGARQCAPTSTRGTPAQTAQVLAGNSPTDQMRPDPRAQEGTRDADRVCTSRSLPAEQAADDGAKAGGTSLAMLHAKGTEERARSRKRECVFLPCCLCTSTCCDVVVQEVQEEGEDTAERDAVAEAAREPVSTSGGEAEAQPPASPVPGNLQHKVDRLEPEEKQPLPTCGPSLHVPAPALKPAHATRKSLNLAYQRHPVATGAGPCQKPAGPRQRAPASTAGTAARTAQVLAPKPGKVPTDQKRPDPRAQEGTGEADRACASRSLAAERAADEGAKAGGTSPAMLRVKGTGERARSSKREGVFLPCCLCTSTCYDAVLQDVQEEREDSPVAEAAEDPVSTASGEAQPWPPASAVSAGARHEGHFVPAHTLLPEDGLSWETENEGFFLRDEWEDAPEQ